jgi:hypothetical protein
MARALKGMCNISGVIDYKWNDCTKPENIMKKRYSHEEEE